MRLLFAVPMRVCRPPPARLRSLPDELADHAAALRARPACGYDWVFPYLYAKSTRSFVRALHAGRLDEPAFVRAWLGQFYEVYARNAARWLVGEPPEPAWGRAARLSRALGRLGGDRHDRRDAALIQALYTVYVHVVVDLPRALLVVHRRVPAPPTHRARHDMYFGVTCCFEPVIEQLVREARVTPEALGRAWPHLPEPVRGLLAGGPIGLGSYLRALRRVARLRFHLLRLDPWVRAEVAAYRESPALTALPSIADEADRLECPAGYAACRCPTTPPPTGTT